MIILIAGVAKNRVIGKNGKLPWNIPEDLNRFKSLTLNHTVLMGRKTFESILNVLGRPLPERTNIIVTRDRAYQAPGCIVVHSIAEALMKADGDIFVIGGQNIYEQTIGLADMLEITEIKKDYEGDAFFPVIGSEWKEVKREDKESGEIKFSFVTYERAQSKS